MCSRDPEEVEAEDGMDTFIAQFGSGYDTEPVPSVDSSPDIRNAYLFKRIRYIIQHLHHFGEGFPMQRLANEYNNKDMNDTTNLLSAWAAFIRFSRDDNYKDEIKTKGKAYLSNPMNYLILLRNIQTLIYIRRLHQYIHDYTSSATRIESQRKLTEPGRTSEPNPSTQETCCDADDDETE